VHKDGQDEVCGGQIILTDALAEGGAAAVAAGPGGQVLMGVGGRVVGGGEVGGSGHAVSF
jgi:hypothetical protein